MADTKKKDSDKTVNEKDVEALIEVGTEYLNGNYDEDTYIKLIEQIAKKMMKNKKLKEKKDKFKEIQMVGNPNLTEFEISYLRNVANQIFKDLGIRVHQNY